MKLTRSQRREAGEPYAGGQLTRLRNQINRLFELPSDLMPFESSLLEGWTPAVDVFEGKDAVTVKAEIPGMKKEDLDVSVEGNTVSICGERREEKETGKGSSNYRSERYFGKFYRTVPLPAAVDSSKVSAKYQDGVLTVTLPKTEEAKSRKIDVQVS